MMEKMTEPLYVKSPGSGRGSRRSSIPDLNGSQTKPDSPKLQFKHTESGNSISVDPNQVVFKTSSLALLRAKKCGHGWKVDSLERDGEISIEGAKKVMQFVYRMWTENKLCDVIIKTRTTEEYAHKLALGAYSSYLEQSFSEYPQGTIVSLDASEYSAKAVTAVLHFVYTTDISIDDEQLSDILGCAHHFGIDILGGICEEYLTDYTVQSAIQHYSLARKYKLKTLQTDIYKFICLNFTDVSKTDSFFYIPHDKLTGLMSDDRLRVTNELEVFYTILRWIDYDRPERLSFAPELMNCVRFALITPEDLVTKVEVMEHIFNILECHQLLYKAMCFHALTATRSSLAGKYGAARGRSYMPSPEAQADGKAGGSSWESQKMGDSPPPSQVRHTAHSKTHRASLHVLLNNLPYPLDQQSSFPDIPDNSSDNVPTTGSKKRKHPLEDGSPPGYNSFDTASELDMEEGEDALPDLLAVAVGGIDLLGLDSDVPGKHLYRFDSIMNRWVAFTMLSKYTHHHAVASVGGELYVVGGAIYDSENPEELGRATNSTLMFEPRSATWHVLAPMKEKRAYHGLASQGDNLFAVGGEDYNKRCLDTVEFYDPIENEWSYLTRIPGGGRIGAAVMTFRDTLYVVGGYDKDREDEKILADVTAFDLLKQKWIQKRPLSFPRCHSSLVVARDRLFLIGGRTRTEGRQQTVTSLATVDMYDEDMDTWQHVADLQTPRHDAGCTVLGGSILVIGGMRTPSLTCLSSVECFNVDVGKWDTTVKQLPFAAAGIACCTIVNPA